MTVNLHDYHYIRNGKASVLVDGQFGSTGKGLLAAYLALQPKNNVDIATSNASANAGHWTKFKKTPEKNFCCFHLPTFGIIQEDSLIYINGGAIINVHLLMQEVDDLQIASNRIIVHPNATIIDPLDIEEEMSFVSQATKISSTRKGVGEALARKIRRVAKIAKDDEMIKSRFKIERLDLNYRLKRGARVSVEIPQGHSLSINGRFYPYCTSRNCNVGQGVADAEIHPNFVDAIAMSLRTYPIRVGSIPGEGYSGDVYSDQEEITFKDLGVEEEYTTVTKRVRRIFTWSQEQFIEAIALNRPTVIFLNFCNYTEPKLLQTIINQIKKSCFETLSYQPSLLLGWGAEVEDVIEEGESNAQYYD
jgi:adenylosuccinate synthase